MGAQTFIEPLNKYLVGSPRAPSLRLGLWTRRSEAATASAPHGVRSPVPTEIGLFIFIERGVLKEKEV